MKVYLASLLFLVSVAAAKRILPGSRRLSQQREGRQQNIQPVFFTQQQQQQIQVQSASQQQQQVNDVLPTFTQQRQGNRIVNVVPANQRRQGRQEQVSGGVDFSRCETDPDTGFCCVEEEETTTSLSSNPILECTHKNVEKCHYTYITKFSPASEEICEENFEKICQITFKGEAVEEQVRKCYRPLIKTCDGQGEEECRTMFESSCTTRYIEKQPGKFVGDTTCEKLPIEICGAGCTTEEGPEECHEKTITSLVDVPEEQCDLNPQQTCRFQTKLVPSLEPEHECTTVPQEICNLRFSQPEQVEKPLMTRWCLDPAPATPGESYEESAALTRPLTNKI